MLSHCRELSFQSQCQRRSEFVITDAGEIFVGAFDIEVEVGLGLLSHSSPALGLDLEELVQVVLSLYVVL